MKKSGARKLFFFYMLFFFAFVAFINFFHSDSILDREADCPACQFQQSNIALAFILFLFFIRFVTTRLQTVSGIIPVFFSLPTKKQSRAPPQPLS